MKPNRYMDSMATLQQKVIHKRIHNKRKICQQFLVPMAWGIHPFPFRTRKLRPTAATILGPQGPSISNGCRDDNCHQGGQAVSEMRISSRDVLVRIRICQFFCKLVCGLSFTGGVKNVSPHPRSGWGD